MKKLTKTFPINGKQVKKYFKTMEDLLSFTANYSIEYSDKFDPSELWLPIPNFSNYEASNLGRLRSLNYKRSGCVKVIKPSIGKDGYLQTMLLNDNGKYQSWKVHKFVSLAFFGERTNKQEVNHKDGIKTNNSPNNLEYCSRSFNMLHAYANGLEKPMRGELNGNAKLSESQVLDIRRTAANSGRYYGRKMLSEKYGISEAHVKDIVNNKSLWCDVLI